MMSQRIFNVNNIAKNIIIYRLWILLLASMFYINETIVEQLFTKLCSQNA